MLAAVIFAVGALIVALTPTVVILIFGRFVLGLGVGLASLVVPLYRKDDWQHSFAEKYGNGVRGLDQTAEAKAQRQAGGAYCGLVVKVGRKEYTVGPMEQALVLVEPMDRESPAADDTDSGAGFPDDDAAAEDQGDADAQADEAEG